MWAVGLAQDQEETDQPTKHSLKPAEGWCSPKSKTQCCRDLPCLQGLQGPAMFTESTWDIQANKPHEQTPWLPHRSNSQKAARLLSAARTRPAILLPQHLKCRSSAASTCPLLGDWLEATRVKGIAGQAPDHEGLGHFHTLVC